MNLSYLAAVVALSVGVASVGCAAPGTETAEESTASTTQALAADCTPAVIVLRHAEDVDDGQACDETNVNIAVEGGTQAIHKDCLTASGHAHANLYAEKLAGWMASKNFCPANKVVTQNPDTSSTGLWPSANPFMTIVPFANAQKIALTLKDSEKKFDETARRALLTDESHSTVIAWDSKGLATKLLPEMTTQKPSAPLRDSVYVFTNMNDTTAKFDLAEYRQYFQDGKGDFAGISGKNGSETYYRFFDGVLPANLAPSDMLICDTSSCFGKTGVSLSESLRK